MAPEQAAGKAVDQRTDLYSLGAVMYVLLARRPVFRGGSLGEVLYKQQFEKPEPLRRHNDEVPEELEHIIIQLLEKDPARRIPNATILGRCLEAMQHALPSPAATMQADASYYQSQPPSDDALGPDAAAVTLPAAEHGPAQDAELPDTQAFTPSAQHPAAQAGFQVPADLPETAAATALPSQTNASVTEPKSTGRFVPVSKEELGKQEFEQSKPAVISLQTWVLAAGLLLVGLAIWYFLQPPTADSLYRRIAAHTEDGKIDSIIQAEDDIRAYLEQYPGEQYTGDPRASKLRKYQHEIELDKLQHKFDRLDRGWTSDENLLPIERAYLEAIGYQRLSTEQCIAKLQALVDLYHSSAETAGPNGDCLTLARRRLQQLKKNVQEFAPEQLEIIQKHLDQADALLATDPKSAQAMYRAAIELYSDKPWAADAVRRAQTALDKIKGPP